LSYTLKTIFKPGFFFILVLFNVQILYSQWVQTNGPGFGFIDRLAVTGDNIITSTRNNGIYVSTDNGTSWMHVTYSLPGVNSFVFSGGNIFAGTSGGIYLTSDYGANWIPVNEGLTNNDVHALAVNGQYIFAGTYGGGVFISTNNGTNWTQINNGLSRMNINSLAVSGTNLFAGTDSAGIYSSTNNGNDWNQKNNGVFNHYIITVAANGSNVFAATEQGVYQSTDNGGNWLLSNLPHSGVSFIVFSGNDVYAGSSGTPTGGNIYRSTNNGADWTGVMGRGSVRAFAASGNNLYVSVFDTQDFAIAQGLFLSTNCGTDWALVGLPTSTVYSLGISGNSVYAGTFFGGIFQSANNNGARMTQIGLETYSVHSIAINGNNIFAATSGPGGYPGRVYRSTNSGISWSGSNNGINSRSVYSLFVSGSKIYAGTSGNGKVFVSNDNGASWNDISNGLPTSIYYVYSVTAYGSYLLAGTDVGLFISTNEGANWTQNNNGIPVTPVNALTVFGNNIFAGTNEGIFISNDNGIDWKPLNDSFANSKVYSFVVSGANIFAGTDNGVIKSENNGSSWTQAGLDSIIVLSLEVNETYLLAGTNGAGLWYRSLSEILPVELASFTAGVGNKNIKLKWSTATELNNTGFDIERSINKSDWMKVGFVKGNGNSNAPINYTYVDNTVRMSGKYYYRLKQIDTDGSFKYSGIVESDLNTPSAFALNQNYPNPFNPGTRISYVLKDKGFVKLKVYDIKGELIRELVNESKDAGYYEIEFDGKGLASGIYIYRIEVTGDGNKLVYSDIKKSILLK
jgi:photosystem II stability/assembly factor-like uncharacterized protein